MPTPPITSFQYCWQGTMSGSETVGGTLSSYFVSGPMQVSHFLRRNVVDSTNLSIMSGIARRTVCLDDCTLYPRGYSIGQNVSDLGIDQKKETPTSVSDVFRPIQVDAQSPNKAAQGIYSRWCIQTFQNVHSSRRVFV